MGVQKKVARVKRIISQRDARLKKNQDKGEVEAKKKAKGDEVIREVYAYDHKNLLESLTPVPAHKSLQLCSSSTIPLSSHHILFLLIPICYHTLCKGSLSSFLR